MTLVTSVGDVKPGDSMTNYSIAQNYECIPTITDDNKNFGLYYNVSYELQKTLNADDSEQLQLVLYFANNRVRCIPRDNFGVV